VGLQHRHRIGADPPLGQAGRQGNLVHEVVDEGGHILAPFGERRHPNRHHRKPVVEVFPEAAGRDLLLEIARGRGDDAHIDLDLLGAADALEGLVDEDAQDLVLRLPRHVGDLIDEQRAEMGLLEGPDLALLAAVRLLDAEQFDLHPFRRDGSRVDDDERRGRAVGQHMDGARGQLLAGARWPDDEDAAVGRGDLLDGVAQMVDRAGAADESRRIRRELL
jgi:hypothetical protein